MKKVMMLMLMALMGISVNSAFAQSKEQTEATPAYTIEGKTVKAVKSDSKGRTKKEPTKTDFLYTGTDGNSYTVYMSDSGSCFVIRTSKKTGKEYRQYLGTDISKELCARMGKEYKPRKSTN